MVYCCIDVDILTFDCLIGLGSRWSDEHTTILEMLLS